MNYFRTALLLAGLTALFLAVGFMIGGQQGVLIALVVALGMNLFAYWNSDKMVLRMYGAREVGPADAPHFYGMVQELAQRGGLPMPKVYVIEEDQPNAFATGRDPEHAAVAATTGLLRTLTHEEIKGVMAHELAHVRNRDTLIMTVTATISGAIGLLANFGMLFGGGRDSEGRPNPTGMIAAVAAALLAPFAAMLVQMAISRSREYEADRAGAALCGNPLWLSSALAKLHLGSQARANHAAEANPATAHLFIVNPLSGGGLRGLFSTHPAMEERIARLEHMAGVAPGTTVRGLGLGGEEQAVQPWGGARRPGPWG